MSILNMSSSRPVPEPELDEFEQLAIALSGRLTGLHFEELPAAIAEALGQLAQAISANACRLVEFCETGSVAREHLAGAAVDASREGNQPSACDTWLLDRLARGEQVVVSRCEDLPLEAMAARAQAR